jgi:FAD/FMN-containing dehydrogenase
MVLETTGTVSRNSLAMGAPTVRLDEQALGELKQNMQGSILLPNDKGYDDARKVWNGMIDRHPALIVQARGTADVIAAVNFGRNQSLPVSVRGGGHNVAGSAIQEGALVVDLSQMRSVRVDPARSVVRVEGGATLGDIDHETLPFGLVLPMGLVSKTGIAGLALHGGLGFLTRKHGTTANQLVAADVVTADGQLHVADETHEPDLLWALRGGGSMGIVTSFEFQLHPLDHDVWVAFVMYPVSAAPRVLQFMREFVPQSPDELMSFAIYWTAPNEEYVPEDFRGKPIIAVLGAWSGAYEQGERAIAPLREIAPPVVDLSSPMPFLAAQQLFEHDYPDGRRYYWKSVYLDEISDELIEVLGNYAAKRPSPLSDIEIWSLGGALSRVNPQDSALARREQYLFGLEANWDDPAEDEANLAWARALFADVQRFATGGSYLNFPGFHEEGETTLRKTFGTNYERLRAVRAKYDPDNLYRFNVRVPAQ